MKHKAILRIRRDIYEGQKSIALFREKMKEEQILEQMTYRKPHQEDEDYYKSL